MTTKRDFITEKLTNFKAFLTEITDVEGNEIPKIDSIVNDLEMGCRNLEMFTEGVLTHILPHHNNLDSLLENYVKSYDVSLTLIKKEDQSKIKRYLDCFCKFVS